MQVFRRQIASASARRICLSPQSNRTSAFASATEQQIPRCRYFSARFALRQDASGSKGETTQDANTTNPAPKRKQLGSKAGKTSLRSVAVSAQRPRQPRPPAGSGASSSPVHPPLKPDVDISSGSSSSSSSPSHRVTAITAASSYDMDAVLRILRSHGFQIDPDATGFESDQVIHARGLSVSSSSSHGDFFVFPSGSVVAWSLPEEVINELALVTLREAAEGFLGVNAAEREDLEYVVDENREGCVMRGDVIRIGEKDSSNVDSTLAKIAFSSGLARSTKLAVLESHLQTYIDSMKPIPPLLARGSRLPFSRSFMLAKTGELLELRAQLNHYSELTDSLPDLFWDSSSELGLEAYYDQVGKSLDVGIRIRTLNDRMDYAGEIAAILRGVLSEEHGVRLEWIIILLIAVEVVFVLQREGKEFVGWLRSKSEEQDGKNSVGKASGV